MKHCSLSYAVLLVLGVPFVSYAKHDKSDPLEHIEVTAQSSQHRHTGATDTLLRDYGVEFSAAGGVSALPVINGLMGDRVAVSVDGASITAACANQMNPPLSYISASQIRGAEVVAGISPVSMGGDNIAGVIAIDTITPQYGNSQQLTWQSGTVGTTYRSNNRQTGINGALHIASDAVSLRYSGAFEDAQSYEDGNGNPVFDTLYRAQNHVLTAAVRDNSQQLAMKVNYQAIPYQGFANQYMDMTDNSSLGVTARYERELDAGRLQLQANWHDVEHAMGFFTPEKTGMMPMLTEASDRSLTTDFTTVLSEHQQLQIGAEYHESRLHDWWPAVDGSMMMGPNDYLNINDGMRRRIAAFIETDVQLSPAWQVLAGVRVEHVTTDTGEVAPYNRMPMMGMPNPDATAADAFNTASRRQSDTLADITLRVTHAPTANHQFQAGIARKNRAPNLYERYSWGMGRMATTMIGWFGDGNGYTGNINLTPETAHTVMLGYTYSNDNDTTAITLAPYYTRVDNYIDVTVLDDFFAFNRTDMPGARRNALQFTNLDATLYGIDLNARQQLLRRNDTGTLSAEISASLSRGSRDHSQQDLYQLMPLDVKLNLRHTLGAWQTQLQLMWVDDKRRVDPRRRENQTESYTLVNISSAFQWQKLRITAGVTNLFDRYYALPLGGVSVADIKMNRTPGFEQLAGQGRSLNLGLQYQF